MDAGVPRRGRGFAVTGLVLLGMVGLAVPAYSAPEDCEGPRSCQPKPDKPPQPPPDTKAPPAPRLGALTVDPKGKVELLVTAEAGAKVVLEEDGTRVVARATATGAPQLLGWTTTDGSHTYAVTATDEAKNKSVPASVTADVDATAPPVKRFVTRSGTGKNSLSQVEVVTEPDTAFRLLVGAKVVQRGTARDGRIAQSLDLADGRHKVRVELEDQVGNLRKATRSLVVRIPSLDVRARWTSEVTDLPQVIQVRAPAASRGVVEVPGERPQEFRLQDGTAEVELGLTDGSYQDVTVTIRDKQGRTGTATLADITVDTTAPVLAVELDRGAATEGKLSAEVSTDESTVVSWRLLDGEEVVAAGEYVAVGVDQQIGRDVDEGGFELEVTATDTYGRTTVELVPARIAADPLSTAALGLAAAGLLLVLGALVAGGVALRRRRRQRPGREDVERPEDGMDEQAADYEGADERWRRRHQALTKALEVARGGAPDVVPNAIDVALMPEEKVLHAAGARLTERIGGDRATPTLEVDRGELVVTNQRLAFVGENHRRDWWLSLVERVAHVDHQHTSIDLRESDTRSGVVYDDPEVTRLYIDLAMAERNGTRTAYLTGLTQGLRDHEMRRPTPPQQ